MIASSMPAVLRPLVLALLLAPFLYAVGCDSDDPSDPDTDTTVDEDIANIDAALDAVLDGAAALERGSLSDAVKAFLQPTAGDYGDADWAEDVIDGLDAVLPFEEVEDDRAFNFASFQGVYTWDIATESWSRAGDVDAIVLRFPTSSSQTANDAELTVSAYSDVGVTIDGDAYRLPSRAEVELTVDGTRVFGLDLREAAYDDGDHSLPIPTAVDLELFTAPFTHTLTFSRVTSTEFTFSFTIRDGSGSRVTGVDLDVDLANSDYDELEEEDIENVAGTLYLAEDLRIEFDGAVGNLLGLDDPSEDQVNALLDLEVFFGEQKIGDLEYDEGDEDILVVYKDGTVESTDRYYDSFLDRLEAIVFTYTGDF